MKTLRENRVSPAPAAVMALQCRNNRPLSGY
jgi:hypothetical protein